MGNDINEKGFLGEHILDYRKMVLDKHKPFFDLVEELNSYSQKKKFDLQADGDNGQQVLSLSLFAKIINDIQTVHILCGYGLTQQGRIILRSTLEGFFLLAKLATDPSFVVPYIQADKINRLILMERSHNYPGPLFDGVRKLATEAAIDELKKDIKSESVQRLHIENIARSVGLEAFYDSVYRVFSQDVHVQARSLEEYVCTGEDGEIASFEWGPQDEDVPMCLATGVDLLIRSWGAIDLLFKVGVESKLQAYREELASLQRDSLIEH